MPQAIAEGFSFRRNLPLAMHRHVSMRLVRGTRAHRVPMQAQHAHIRHAHAPLKAKTHLKAGTLGGVTLQRTRPRLMRMRQLCAVAVWAPHVRLWHRLEHASRRLALRWVLALAELPAMAQRDELNQLYHARTECAMPCCRCQRLGSVMGSQWDCQRILPLGL